MSRRVSPEIEPLTSALVCIECGRPWLVPAERWRLKVMAGQPPETVPYCADCAMREFGPARPRLRGSG